MASVFFRDGCSTRYRRRYLAAASADPTVELAALEESLPDIDTFVNHPYYDVVLLDELVDRDFPVVHARTNGHRPNDCFVLGLVLFVSR